MVLWFWLRQSKGVVLVTGYRVVPVGLDKLGVSSFLGLGVTVALLGLSFWTKVTEYVCVGVLFYRFHCVIMKFKWRFFCLSQPFFPLAKWKFLCLKICYLEYSV